MNNPVTRLLSAVAQEARLRAAHAISLARADATLSMTQAAREAGTTLSTVRRYMPTAVTQDDRGRYRATRADRERFVMSVVTVEQGPTAVTVAGSNKRSLVGRHHAAISAHLASGDRARLDALRGQKVGGLTLQTDPNAIRELYRQGELSFLEIYALTR